MHDWSDRIALVFSSGVAKRACAFGVIKTMEKMGYMVSSVAGISKGALVAGLYTAGKLDTNLTEYSLSKKGLQLNLCTINGTFGHFLQNYGCRYGYNLNYPKATTFFC